MFRYAISNVDPSLAYSPRLLSSMEPSHRWTTRRQTAALWIWFAGLSISKQMTHLAVLGLSHSSARWYSYSVAYPIEPRRTVRENWKNVPEPRMHLVWTIECKQPASWQWENGFSQFAKHDSGCRDRAIESQENVPAGSWTRLVKLGEPGSVLLALEYMFNSILFWN